MFFVKDGMEKTFKPYWAAEAWLGYEFIVFKIDCIYFIFLQLFDFSFFNLGGSTKSPEPPLDLPQKVAAFPTLLMIIVVHGSLFQRKLWMDLLFQRREWVGMKNEGIDGQ